MVTSPEGVIFRIVLLLISATYRLPPPSTAIPQGPLNLAALPIPSALPGNAPEEPAKVVTTPADVIFRTVLLPQSATNTFPSPSTATPAGYQNLAALPVPSTAPAAPGKPANVDTAPAWVTFRIVRLWKSATKTFPLPSTATPEGLENRAAYPVPSAVPEIPGAPANVDTTPAGVTFRIVSLSSSAT